MKPLKTRKTPLQSAKKLATAVDIYQRLVDEPIDTINIWSPTRYTINGRWSVDISTNKVEYISPDYDDY